jgi:hypothetical protein
MVLAPAGGGGAADGGSGEPVEKTELQILLHSIPYRRLLLWGFVAAVAWQLHEFFGVSLRSARHAWVLWAFAWHCRSVHPWGSARVGEHGRLVQS